MMCSSFITQLVDCVMCMRPQVSLPCADYFIPTWKDISPCFVGKGESYYPYITQCHLLIFTVGFLVFIFPHNCQHCCICWNMSILKSQLTIIIIIALYFYLCFQPSEVSSSQYYFVFVIFISPLCMLFTLVKVYLKHFFHLHCHV